MRGDTYIVRARARTHPLIHSLIRSFTWLIAKTLALSRTKALRKLSPWLVSREDDDSMFLLLFFFYFLSFFHSPSSLFLLSLSRSPTFFLFFSFLIFSFPLFFLLPFIHPSFLSLFFRSILFFNFQYGTIFLINNFSIWNVTTMKRVVHSKFDSIESRNGRP